MFARNRRVYEVAAVYDGISKSGKLSASGKRPTRSIANTGLG